MRYDRDDGASDPGTLQSGGARRVETQDDALAGSERAMRQDCSAGRLQPGTAQVSRIHLLPFFDAPAYTLAYLLVISALACTR
jgi:hypothetical protein